MGNFIDINKMVFSGTPAENKLHYIKTLSKEEIRKTTDGTILRIYNECRGDRDRFYIDGSRRDGNNLGGRSIWNSNIEFIYEYNGKAYIMLYVQNSKTDTSESVKFDNFNSGVMFNGWSDYLNTRFRYDDTDIANVIRCILAEYVYYTEVEKAAREEQERLNSILHYSIVNPVYNRFYNEWRCKYQGGYPGAPHDRLDRYHRGEKAVEEYAKANVDKLCGKSKEELQAIYTKIFEETK